MWHKHGASVAQSGSKCGTSREQVWHKQGASVAQTGSKCGTSRELKRWPWGRTWSGKRAGLGLVRDSCSMAPGSVVEWKKVASHSLLARAYHVTVGKLGSVQCSEYREIVS